MIRKTGKPTNMYKMEASIFIISEKKKVIFIIVQYHDIQFQLAPDFCLVRMAVASVVKTSSSSSSLSA